MSLKAGTRDPQFSSFFVADKQLVLNIIDTPGLFERGNKSGDLRDNNTIMDAIAACINNEITKLHMVCFCVAVCNGINQEDIDSIIALKNFLGETVTENACLIITHCESDDQQQQEKWRQELLDDKDFGTILPCLKKGIFFSGSLKREDVNRGYRESVMNQFETIIKYRETLLELFIEEKNPFLITETKISEIREWQQRRQNTVDEAERKLENLKNEKQEEINRLQSESTKKQEEINKLQSEFTKKQEEVSKFQCESTKKQEEINRFQSESAKKQEEINRIRSETTKKQEEVNKFQSESTKKQEEINRLQSESTKKQEEIDRLQSESKRKEDKISELQSESKNKQKEIDELKKKSGGGCTIL
ncbi:unnamed protein product [Adineta steineri]|uniref:AIG1-type G domain-containing protein n=1 Tax=Adineta steineri TaxID=433720 RepID=A0A815N3E5_9BILA|nr:unnamed protein product [Adineta steineri]CAF3874448.1 unnamed protein product [Adineta steineri]